MARPVKWSRDLHPIRERALRSRTETWSRLDIQHLFTVGSSSAQSLMKAVGEVQVAGAHFVERQALLAFLDEMVTAPSVEELCAVRYLSSGQHPAVERGLMYSFRCLAHRPALPPTIHVVVGKSWVEAEEVTARSRSYPRGRKTCKKLRK